MLKLQNRSPQRRDTMLDLLKRSRQCKLLPWTNTELLAQVHLFDLSPWGISPKARIGLVLHPGMHSAVGLISALTWYCVVPLNPSSTTAGAVSQLESCRCTCLVSSAGIAFAAAAAAQAGLPLITLRNNNEVKSEGAFTLQPHCMSGSAHACRTADFEMESGDVVLILFTSGTTGKPKRVVFPLSRLLNAGRMIAETLALRPEDMALNFLPLHHIGGISCNIMAPLMSDSGVVCASEFTAEKWFSLVSNKETPISWCYAVPAIWRKILEYAEDCASKPPTPFLRIARSAGGPLTHEDALRLADLLGAKATVLPTYGMTECMPICSPPLCYQLERPGSVGPPIVPLRIVDQNNVSLPQGEVGEIALVKVSMQDQLFDGYENDAPLHPGQVFRTGDRGHLDSTGWLYHMGRSKEMVNRGGETIPTAEIEEVVRTHPSVVEAMVFSAPHVDLGEVVAVAAVCVGRSIDVHDLRSWATSQLTSAQLPHVLVITEVLPWTAKGSLKRVGYAEELGLPAVRGGVLHTFSFDLQNGLSELRVGEAEQESRAIDSLQLVLGKQDQKPHPHRGHLMFIVILGVLVSHHAPSTNIAKFQSGTDNQFNSKFDYTHHKGFVLLTTGPYMPLFDRLLRQRCTKVAFLVCGAIDSVDSSADFVGAKIIRPSMILFAIWACTPYSYTVSPVLARISLSFVLMWFLFSLVLFRMIRAACRCLGIAPWVLAIASVALYLGRCHLGLFGRTTVSQWAISRGICKQEHLPYSMPSAQHLGSHSYVCLGMIDHFSHEMLDLHWAIFCLAPFLLRRDCTPQPWILGPPKGVGVTVVNVWVLFTLAYVGKHALVELEADHMYHGWGPCSLDQHGKMHPKVRADCCNYFRRDLSAVDGSGGAVIMAQLYHPRLSAALLMGALLLAWAVSYRENAQRRRQTLVGAAVLILLLYDASDASGESGGALPVSATVPAVSSSNILGGLMALTFHLAAMVAFSMVLPPTPSFLSRAGMFSYLGYLFHCFPTTRGVNGGQGQFIYNYHLNWLTSEVAVRFPGLLGPSLTYLAILVAIELFWMAAVPTALGLFFRLLTDGPFSMMHGCKRVLLPCTKSTSRGRRSSWKPERSPSDSLRSRSDHARQQLSCMLVLFVAVGFAFALPGIAVSLPFFPAALADVHLLQRALHGDGQGRLWAPKEPQVDASVDGALRTRQFFNLAQTCRWGLALERARSAASHVALQTSTEVISAANRTIRPARRKPRIHETRHVPPKVRSAASPAASQTTKLPSAVNKTRVSGKASNSGSWHLGTEYPTQNVTSVSR